MKKFRKVTIGVSVLTAILFTGCTSKETKSFNEYMDNGDYIEAAAYYEENQTSIDAEDLPQMLVSETKVIMNAFTEGEMSLSEATANITALLSIAPVEINSDLNENLVLLSSIEISQGQYELGEEFLASGQYNDAILCFSNVIAEDPLYSDAQGKLTIAGTKLEEEQKALEKQDEADVRNYIDQGKYEEALMALNDFKSKYPDSSITDSLTEEIQKAVESEMNQKVTSYFEEYDFTTACSYVEDLMRTFEFESISDKLNSLEDEFTEYILEEADKDASAKNYESACAIVEIAMQEVGEDNEELNAAYNEYMKHMPIYLADMEYMSIEGWVEIDEQLLDNTSTLHRNSLYVCDYDNDSSVEYFINGNYETLTGVCGCSYDKRNSSRSMYFEIYGDGKLLYTSSTMTANALPENFQVDVSGVRVLKIWYPNPDYTSWDDSDECSIATIYDGLLMPVSDDDSTAPESDEN